MNRYPFGVKKRTLLAIAGAVWMIAGFNVARLGVLSYQKLLPLSVLPVFLSILVFCCFGFMFYRITVRHIKRIREYKEALLPVWRFFDLKSYCIMAVMMGGGIWLRTSGLVSDSFIAIFYTGLGCALTLAGVLFWIKFGGKAS
ncbi:MAG: hypothetical protein ACI4D2_02545 [Lachnospiraceae bacterium]